jgi:hypothetical protein
MKRFFVVVSVALMLLVSIPLASAGGGSDSLTDEQIAQIAEVQKKKINRLDFFFVPAIANVDQIGYWAAAKYRFSVDVVDGAYDAEFQGIEVGEYFVYAFADVDGYYAFGDEKIPVSVLAGETSVFVVNFKMLNHLLIPCKIPVTLGSFKEDEQYEIKIQNASGTFSENNYAQMQGENLVFNLWAYSPYKVNGEITLSVVDQLGNNVSFTAKIDIMDYVNSDGQSVTLIPVDKLEGSVYAKIKFVHNKEMSGRLIYFETGEAVNAVYLLYEGKRYYIPNYYSRDYTKAIFDSWGWDNSMVEKISQVEMESYPLGRNITIRPGTYLLKTVRNDNIYAVEYGGKLRLITADALPLLYGNNWQERVVIVPDVFFPNYSINWRDYIAVSGGVLTGVPTGTIISAANDQGDGGLLVTEYAVHLLTANGVSANRYQEKFFIPMPPIKIKDISQIIGWYLADLDFRE